MDVLSSLRFSSPPGLAERDEGQSERSLIRNVVQRVRERENSNRRVGTWIQSAKFRNDEEEKEGELIDRLGREGGLYNLSIQEMISYALNSL